MDAQEYVIENVCKNCNSCESYGYIGCDTVRFAQKAYRDGVESEKKPKAEIVEDAIDWIQDTTKKSIAKELIELKCRLEWHDLEKEPNDLPPTDKMVLCMTYPKEGWYASGKYNGTSWNTCYGEEIDVLAWKEMYVWGL